MDMKNITLPIAFDDGTVEKHTLSAWGKRYDLDPWTIYDRYKRGVVGQDLLAPMRNDRLSAEVVYRLWHGRWRYVKKVKRKHTDEPCVMWRDNLRWVFVGK